MSTDVRTAKRDGTDFDEKSDTGARVALTGNGFPVEKSGEKELGLFDEEEPHHTGEPAGGQPIEINSACQVLPVEYR